MVDPHYRTTTARLRRGVLTAAARASTLNVQAESTDADLRRFAY
jgi:hypothetical protein